MKFFEFELWPYAPRDGCLAFKSSIKHAAKALLAIVFAVC
jgi:hypothetical protein